jgi:predicted RNase H-like HicB family nuclease
LIYQQNLGNKVKVGENMKFNIVLDKADEGGFNVVVPALDGCFTQGDTMEEAIENAREAIVCYLEGLEKLNEIKTKPDITTREVEVAI